MSQDLNGLYVKHMRHHGCGEAMFQPIAFADMTPPCCGYFDHNGKWNLIARLSEQLHDTDLDLDMKPLERKPQAMSKIGLKWQPKCSMGVRMFNVDISGKSPDVGVPVGGDAHIKYQSKLQFRAVLIARSPVTVTALNDECSFKNWIQSNKSALYNRFGRQLKKYGMWVVTVTYTAPGCSINAWLDKDKEANLSAKAKASMVGDYGAELDWKDNVTDKDWCHYSGDPTRWCRKGNDTQRTTSQSGDIIQTESTPEGSEKSDPSCSVTKSEDSTTKAATTSASDQQPQTAQVLNGQPASTLSGKADASPVDEHTNLPSAEPTSLNPHVISQDETPSNDRRDERHSSQGHTEDVGKETQPSDLANNEGVVLFFDGIRVDRAKWWYASLKKSFTFGQDKAGKDHESRRERWSSSKTVTKPPTSQSPGLVTKETGGSEESSPLSVPSK